MIVVGIMPSEHSTRDPLSAMRNRASVRQTWLKEQPSDIVVKFVGPRAAKFGDHSQEQEETASPIGLAE